MCGGCSAKTIEALSKARLPAEKGPVYVNEKELHRLLPLERDFRQALEDIKNSNGEVKIRGRELTEPPPLPARYYWVSTLGATPEVIAALSKDKNLKITPMAMGDVEGWEIRFLDKDDIKFMARRLQVMKAVADNRPEAAARRERNKQIRRALYMSTSRLGR